MILKLSRDAGTRWIWLDKIDEVEDFGVIWERAPHVADSDGGMSGRIWYVTHFGELIEAVNSVWGDQRQFDHEIWPSMPGPLSPDNRDCATSDVPLLTPCVSTVKARRGKEEILIVLIDEAFLLGDNGDTIERLR